MSVFDTAGRPKIAYNPTTRVVLKGATFASQVALVTGIPDTYVDCPVAGTIVGVKIFTTGGTGSCSIGISKKAFASFPPTWSGDSIVASDIPTISSGTDYSDAVLTGWTTAVSAGDVLGFHLISNSIFTSITIQLEFAQAG